MSRIVAPILFATLGAALGAAACGGPPPATPPEPIDAGTSGPSSTSPHTLPGDAKGGATTKPEDEKKTSAGVKPAGGLGVYSHLWTAETKDWNGGLLLTKDGDLLSFSSGGIRVHARDDGRVLHRANGCAPVSEDGLAFVADDRFVVVCDAELREFSWPRLGSKKLASFAARVDEAAVAGNVAAVAEDGFFAKDKKGRVLLYDLRDGRVVDEFVPPAEVDTLALSSDGSKLFVGTREAGIVIRDLRSKTNQVWTDKGDGDGAAFAPDGKSIFGDFASFEASTVELATKKATKTWHVGSWLTAARWIDGTTIAATGSDGLLIYSAAEAGTPAPIGDLGEGIALSKDAGTLCAGGRSGRIACFGRAKPAPTTIADAFGSASSASGADSERAGSPEIDGKILRRSGKTLLVSVDPGAAIEVGATGSVSKPFNTNVGIALSGWIVIAEVKVTRAASGELTLEILQEKSAMSMNGRPVSHFAPGAVRLALSPPR